jgi:hypothetical protein
MKALNKAQRGHDAAQASNHTANEHHVDESISNPTHDKSLSKSIDLHTIFLGVLIVLAAAGVYLNYNISSKLASTQFRMGAISDNFKVQQDQLNKVSALILQRDILNDGQNREFIAKIDLLSVSVGDQITEVNKLSKAQYSTLSKTIEDQQKSIANLTSKYEQLDKSVANFSDVNNRHIEQLNLLKKKVAELNAIDKVNEL